MTKLKMTTIEVKEKLDKLYKTRQEIIELWQKTKLTDTLNVTREDVAGVVSRMTKIPLKELTAEEKYRLLNLEGKIQERLIGQKEAVCAVCEAIRRSRAGLKDINRPIGSFLFLGPSGVGKTELAKALSEVLYGSEELIIRVDMSEYMERHSISKLIGAPPGYIGYDEGGQLTEIVHRRPFSIILLDEIEKAHPEVYNILLQIMEDGRLTDGQGRLVDFKNTIIIMTSNLGSELIYKETLGFNLLDSAVRAEKIDYEGLQSSVMEKLRTSFKPEFLNRINEMVVFKPLYKEDLLQICRLELGKLNLIFNAQEMELNCLDEVIELLVEMGYDPKYGARPIKRLIQKEIENPVSTQIIKGRFKAGDVVEVYLNNKKKISFRKK